MKKEVKVLRQLLSNPVRKDGFIVWPLFVLDIIGSGTSSIIPFIICPAVEKFLLWQCLVGKWVKMEHIFLSFEY